MGAKEIREQLDNEIQGLEQMIFSDQTQQPSGAPTESDAADQLASSSQQEDAGDFPRPASGTEQQPLQSEKNFNIDQALVSQDSQDTTNQEEPTTQNKRVSWKQRFIKLKQYHDSERYKDRTLTGQLYDQIASHEAEISRLNNKVADLQKAMKPSSIRDLATEEEIAAIGEDELTAMDKLTRRAVETSTKDLKARLEATEAREREGRGRAAQDAKSQAYSIFLQRLEALVPDYAVIDVDKRFDAWLELVDPPSGFKRKTLFKQAETSGDVGRVAGFFNEFKRLVSPSNQTLASKVTPVGSSKAQPTNNNNQGQPELVPMASYEQFMEDVTRGRFKGRETEAKKWEVYFDTALAEGRLR